LRDIKNKLHSRQQVMKRSKRNTHNGTTEEDYVDERLKSPDHRKFLFIFLY
jgi:hypothetical protein